MDLSPAILELIRFFVNLLSMSLPLGLIFLVLLTPRRDELVYAFIGFALSLVFWGVALFVRFSPINAFIPSLWTMSVFATVLFTKSLTFYFFTIAILEKRPPWLRYANSALLPFTLYVIWLITSGEMLASLSDDTFTYTISSWGYGGLTIAIIYLIIAFYLLSTAQTRTIRILRLPALLVIMSYLVNAVPAFNNLPIDTLLTLAATIWMGFIIVQRQLFNPLKDLNADLQNTNRNLKKAITDLEREKMRVDALNQDLARANHHKSEFMATMSHELRTPLNSIIGYSELLLNDIYGELAHEQRDRLERIHRNGQHLSHLINAVLDLNRMDAGQVDLNITPVDVPGLVASIHQKYAPHAQEKQLAFDYHLAPGLPVLQADTYRLEQVLTNLIDNAIKFTLQGEVTLHADPLIITDGVGQLDVLPARGWLGDGQWILFRITDTGIGISEDMQSMVFDRFAQVETGHARNYDGIGLGLPLTTRIVEMHKGSIWLKSRPQQGTTIFVAFPIVAR